jgi:hypothetical protein
MAKLLYIWILAGSIAGGIIYSLFVSYFDYFTPITGILAGFVGCILLIESPGKKKDLPVRNILMFIGLSILSLFFGYVSLYYVKSQFWLS